MTGKIEDLLKYRIERAYETLADARLLADGCRWNSCINRLYYASFYSVNALLLKNNFRTHTHNGCKSKFFLEFIKTGIIDKDYGKLYSDLFDWRQEGDYADFIAFDQVTVIPLLNQTENFIIEIEKHLK
ncbi:MAG: HEPN domain-containing protein [Bacteroidales bacterium]